MSRGSPRAAFAIAILFALLVASPQGAAQAPVPTHDVGDAVGFGANVDITALAAPFLDQLRAQDAMDPNVTFHELNVTGSADIWVRMEVVGETPEYYGIREDHAAGVRAHFVANVTTTRFPAPGTHRGTIDPTFGCILPAIPETTGGASADIQISLLSTSSGMSKWNVSDFALRESRTNHTIDMQIASSFRHVPNIEFNATACEIVVTYENSDLTISVDVDADIRVIYAPALDYFDFPISDGETWTATSDAIVGGRIRGTIDVVGLDPTDEQAFFDMLNANLAAMGLTVTGLTGFPIVLEQITVTVIADRYLQAGVIDDIPVPVALSLQTRQATMTLADGNFHTVYLISTVVDPGFPASPCSWVYSPDDGFIVGYVCEIQPGVPFFELENVQPGQAQQEITDTKSTYAIGAQVANPVVDFFVKPPFLGLLLIAAAAILIAALLVRRRRKSAMAPIGPAQPQAMPPPPPP